MPHYLFELDGLIAGFGHGFQHIALARNLAIIKLAEGIPRGKPLRTGGVGVCPGSEIQAVLGMHHVVDRAGEPGADKEVLEFLQYRGRLNRLVVVDLDIGGEQIQERRRAEEGTPTLPRGDKRIHWCEL